MIKKIKFVIVGATDCNIICHMNIDVFVLHISEFWTWNKMGNNVNRSIAPIISNPGANLSRVLNFVIPKIYSLKSTPEWTKEEVGRVSDSFWNFSSNKKLELLPGFEPLVVQSSAQLLYWLH